MLLGSGVSALSGEACERIASEQIRVDHLIISTPVNCESPKPLRTDVKAPRSLRENEQEEQHAQTKEAEHDHFDF